MKHSRVIIGAMKKSMCLSTLVHTAGNGASIPRIGVAEPLQALPFSHSPRLKQCAAAWALLIFKISE